MPTIFEPSQELLNAQAAGTLGSVDDGTGVAPNGGSQIWIGASPQNGDQNWGGCQVWLSFDGTTYVQIGTIASRANQGTLTATLAGHSGSNPDTTDSLAIDLSMSGGGLPTATEADAQASRTLAYVDGEYLAFGSTTPTTSDAYDLTYLYRGLYGSSAGSHASGAAFLLLDDNIFKYNLPTSYAGTPLYFKFPSFNAVGVGLQNLATLTAVTYVPVGGVVPSGVITGGDASVSAAGIITLAATGVTAGSFTLADITVDGKGRVTAASSGAVAVPAGANPTATVSGTATNGAASTFMRSDAAPALSTTGVTAGSYTYGSFAVDANGRLTAASSGAAPPAAANPTGVSGLTVINGSATTFMRSDAAPALNQGISPTWTGVHTFTSAFQVTANTCVFGGSTVIQADGAHNGTFQAVGSRPTFVNWTNGGTGLALAYNMVMSRGSGAGNFSANGASDEITWSFWGDNGSAFTRIGQVAAGVQSVSGADLGGELIFATSNASGTLTNAFTIDNAQNLQMGPSRNKKIADANGILYTAIYTVVALPAAATVGAGARAFVIDATATNFASSVSGGGSNGVPVYSDGTTWRVG